MKIFSNLQVQQLDQITIQKHYNHSWNLMEKAATALLLYLEENELQNRPTITIFCGKGNNGGDGLALARMLISKKYQVNIFLFKTENYSLDNQLNQDLLKQSKTTIQTFELESILNISKNTIIIDALFGTGLQKALDPKWQNIFNQIYKSKPLKIIAIDLPSGLLNGIPMKSEFSCLKADSCISFQFPKLALLLPDNKIYLKAFSIVNIDLDNETMQAMTTDTFYIDQNLAISILQSPDKFSHKGNFGHCLIIGGHYGSIGAPILSANAALKTGSGLVSIYSPKCANNIIQTSINEVISISDKEEDIISSITLTKEYNSFAIGMGLGTHPKTAFALKQWLPQATENCIVLDADSINILAKDENPFKNIPKGSILTPHPKELERLIGIWENDYEKLEKVKVIAQTYKIIFIIKGAHSTVICPDGNMYFNSTGNWGMATAGSGDVLSGIIASLIGQGYKPIEASILGVFLHGLAGDNATKTIHPHSIIASDLINNISNAYFSLEKN